MSSETGNNNYIPNYLHAIESQKDLYDKLFEANNRLEDKAVNIFQAASIVAGLIFAGSLISKSDLINWLSIPGLIALAFLFGRIIYITIQALKPVGKTAPHGVDWDTLFRRFILVEEEKAYRESIEAYQKASSDALIRNDYLAGLVEHLGICLIWQIIALALILAGAIIFQS